MSCTCFENRAMGFLLIFFNVCVLHSNVNMKIKNMLCVTVPGVFCLFDCQKQEHDCLLGEGYDPNLVDFPISYSTRSELHSYLGSEVNIFTLMS